MPQYFLTKIRYQEPIDEITVGSRNRAFIKQKSVTESRLFDAVSFTDAEARTYNEVAANTPDFQITHNARYAVADVFRHDDGEIWYRIKMYYITENERTGKEKKITNLMLVNAASPEEALSRIRENLKTMLLPYVIKDVIHTDILEVVDYVKEENEAVADQPNT